MAHPRIVAQRSEAARGRLRAALDLLAARAGLTEALAPARFERVPELKAVVELETLADNLETLAGALPRLPTAPPTEVKRR